MNIMFTWIFDIGHPAPTKSTWPQFICALSVHLLACPSLTTPKTSIYTPVLFLILFWDTKHDSEWIVIIYANLVGSCFDFFSRFFLPLNGICAWSWCREAKMGSRWTNIKDMTKELYKQMVENKTRLVCDD